MKEISINGIIFQYKIDWTNSDIRGCWTNFYFGTELKSYFFFKKEVPKYAFSVPINIEDAEYSKEEVRHILTARTNKYFSEQNRAREISNGLLI